MLKTLLAISLVSLSSAQAVGPHDHVPGKEETTSTTSSLAVVSTSQTSTSTSTCSDTSGVETTLSNVQHTTMNDITLTNVSDLIPFSNAHFPPVDVLEVLYLTNTTDHCLKR